MYKKLLLPFAGALAALAALVMTGAVSAAPPVANGGVSISGRNYDVGQVLTAKAPTYATQPDSVAFHWERCTGVDANGHGTGCTPIPAASAPAYTIAADDLGNYLEAVVDATNVDGTTRTTGVKFPVTGAPNPFSAPTFSNTVGKVGDTVSVSDGTWNTPAGHSLTAVTYQWTRCPSNSLASTGCSGAVDIPGATGKTYTVTQEDMGVVLGARVTAADDYGSSNMQVFTGYRTGYPTPAGTQPSFTGHASNPGDVVTATHGDWTSPDGSPITYGYQWQSCPGVGPGGCTDIAGATDSAYTVQASDMGKRLAYKLAVTNGTGTTTQFVTLFYVVGGPAMDLNDVAKVVGTGHPGETLTASEGHWFFGDGHPISFGYEWYSCDSAFLGPDSLCTKIAGETSRTYVVRSSDKYIALIVWAQNDLGRGGWFTDDALPITEAPAAPAPPADPTPPPADSSSPPPAQPAPVQQSTPASSASTSADPASAGSLALSSPLSSSSAPTVVTWAPNTFGAAPAQVSANVLPPQQSAGLEFAAGSAVVQIEAVDALGQPITKLNDVLDIAIPNSPATFTPVYQRGNEPWVVIPPLAGTTLAAGQPDGWYRDGTTLHILTRHLTKFALAKALEVKWGTRRTVQLHSAKRLAVYASPSVDANATFFLRKGSKVVGSWQRSIAAGAGKPVSLELKGRRVHAGTYRLTIVLQAGPQHWTHVASIRFAG